MDMRSESYINLQEYSGKKRQSPYSWGEPEQCLFLFLTGIIPNKKHVLQPISDHPKLSGDKQHFAIRYDEYGGKDYFESYDPVPFCPRDTAHLRLMFDPTNPDIAHLYVERPPEQRTTKFSDSNSIGGKVFHFVLRKTGDED